MPNLSRLKTDSDNSGLIPISTVPWHGWTACVFIFDHQRRSEYFNMDQKIHIQRLCQKKIFQYRYDLVHWRHATKCGMSSRNEACISYCVRYVKGLKGICIWVFLCDICLYIFIFICLYRFLYTYMHIHHRQNWLPCLYGCKCLHDFITKIRNVFCLIPLL